jgi:HEAT repeat protein
VEARNQTDAVEYDRQHAIGLLQHLHVFDVGIREAARQALRGLERRSIISILTSCLADIDDQIRADAAEVLLDLDAYHTLPSIMPLLDDPNPALRWHICGLLSTFADARVVLPLTKILLEDPVGDVRFMAALSLRESGDARALPALTESQQDLGTDYEGRRIADMATEAILAICARYEPDTAP